MRIAITRPGEVLAGWAVIAELAASAGVDVSASRSADVFEQLVAAVPFYEGLTLDEIGGQGVRWPEREQAAALGPTDVEPPAAPVTRPAEPAAGVKGALALGVYRPIWASPECEISPALQYLIPAQQVELSPQDAQRLGIDDGDTVTVSQNGTRLGARATVRSSVPAGTAFLATGIAVDSANALTEPTVEVHKS
jgi:predicted molibdopterin-dependent oxidoreductase YjgC